MALASKFIIDRLRTNLRTSGLQEQNQALFQVIDQLIQFVTENARELGNAELKIEEIIIPTPVDSTPAIMMLMGRGKQGIPDSGGSNIADSDLFIGSMVLGGM